MKPAASLSSSRLHTPEVIGKENTHGYGKIVFCVGAFSGTAAFGGILLLYNEASDEIHPRQNSRTVLGYPAPIRRSLLCLKCPAADRCQYHPPAVPHPALFPIPFHRDRKPAEMPCHLCGCLCRPDLSGSVRLCL